MTKEEAEKYFVEYREQLHSEARRLASYISLYKRLYERKSDRLDEMNTAPAFFQITVDALFTAIVLWTDKLFGERSERGFAHFLTFIEHHLSVFHVSELKRRRNYPDGHWMLNRSPIALKTIQDDRKEIRDVESLTSFKLRRDKFNAHFDKDYFFDRHKLANEAPIKWADLDKLLKLMSDILNRYSVAYDGCSYSITPINVNDVDHLLNKLHRIRKGS